MPISWPATVLNTIVAESLDFFAEAIEKKGGDTKKAAFEVMKEVLKESKKVVFNENGYAHEWEVEAGKRGLPNFKNTPAALKAFGSDKAKKLFSKYEVLSEVEVGSRFNIAVERYIKELEIETDAAYDIALAKIVPAGIAYQTKLAESIEKAEKLGADVAAQKDLLKKISSLTSSVLKGADALKSAKDKASAMHDEEKKAEFYNDEVKAKMAELRSFADDLEILVDSELWSLPKYWEMLFVF
jgi:glutamine synthetase